MHNISIAGLGCHIPGGKVTNDDILATVADANRTSLEADALDLLLYGCRRKFDFLGISTRSAPLAGSDDSFVSMAVRAARKALAARTDDCRDPVDCIIACGISNPFREPSAACIIARELGISPADHFDINDTCNGFLKAIELASLYIASGTCRTILVVTAENPPELANGLGMNLTVESVDEMDYRLSSCIIGSGAAAMLLCSDTGKHRIVRYRNRKETTHWDSSLIRIPGTSMPETKYGKPIDGFWADGRGTAAELISANPAFVAESLTQWNLTPSDISFVVLHQLGANITFAILDKLGIPHTKAPVNTFSECGNMGSVNIPANLALAQDRGLLHDGDRILLINSACGFTHAAALIEW